MARDVPGVVIDSLQFEQPAALDKPLELRYKLTAGQYAHSAGTLLLVRPRVSAPCAALRRQASLRAHRPDATGRWHDSFDIALPPATWSMRLPDPINVDVEFATYHSTYHGQRKSSPLRVAITPSARWRFRRQSRIFPAARGSNIHRREGHRGAEEGIGTRFHCIPCGSLSSKSHEPRSFFFLSTSLRSLCQPHRCLADVSILLAGRLRH